MRLVSGVMFVLFAVAVVLQFNDPDPVQWCAIYGASMVLAGWSMVFRRVPWAPVLAVAAVALVWAASLAPGVLREAEMADLVRTMKHENHAEEARELGGLLVVSVWNLLLGIPAFRRR